MSNEIVKKESQEKELFNVLHKTLYQGCKKESVELVLSYCKAAKLDPMLKPVHIVPMSVKDHQTNTSKWQDTLMPGIGLYRILAERSGKYAGIDEPEFGEDVTEKHGETTFTYPKWCKITVYKIINGQKYAFSAKEFWKENFASNKDGSPNFIWFSRPYGQLAKCTESQVLRRTFPEFITSQPTFEEMDGKNFIDKNNSINTVKEEKLYDSKADEIYESVNNNTEDGIVIDNVVDLKSKPVFDAKKWIDRIISYGSDYEEIIEACCVESIEDITESHTSVLKALGLKVKKESEDIGR